MTRNALLPSLPPSSLPLLAPLAPSLLSQPSQADSMTTTSMTTLMPLPDHTLNKMDIGHGCEDGFTSSQTITTATPTHINQRITIPPIRLLKNVKQHQLLLQENIMKDDEEDVINYHEIFVKLITIENDSKIKVQLESNPNFDQNQAEKRREWCKLLENNFKNIGTTTSQHIISQIYGNNSKRMNKTSTGYSSFMDLSLPVFTTHKELIIYRDEIPEIDFIPKSLFELKFKDIYLYEQRHSLRIENIKTPITHLQIHMVREESQFMDEDIDGFCNTIRINIKCSMTEPERVQFYSLFDKVSEARSICKNSKLLFAHPQPHTLFELCEKFGFIVDDVFDWFVEGFYFKRRIGRNPNLVSSNAKYLILDLVYLHDCTELEINSQ
nr:unnamed protein product [Naegleria fowleri]